MIIEIVKKALKHHKKRHNSLFILLFILIFSQGFVLINVVVMVVDIKFNHMLVMIYSEDEYEGFIQVDSSVSVQRMLQILVMFITPFQSFGNVCNFFDHLIMDGGFLFAEVFHEFIEFWNKMDIVHIKAVTFMD